MTVRLRLALAALWLAAPGAALAQRAHESPSSPPAAAQVAPAPAPSGDDAFVFPDDAVEHDGMGFGMGFDAHELLAFGFGDDFDLDTGDLDGGGDLMAMADGDDFGPAAGPRAGPGLHAAPGAPGANGPGAGVHPGMGGGMGMPGGAGIHGDMGMRRGSMSGRPMMHRRMASGMRHRMAQLELSDVQRDQLRALHEANARKGVQRRADMQLARMDLHKLMRADKPELGAINAQIDKLARLRADGMKSAVETRLQARAVLTPEQLKSLRSRTRPMMMQHDMMDGSEPPKH